MSSQRISIIDILTIYFERKRFIVVSLLIIAAATVLGTQFLKKYYTARAMLLPSSSSSFSNPLSALMGDIQIDDIMKSFNFLDGGSDNDQVLTILESRRISEKVVERFNLAKRYKFTKRKKHYIEDVIIAFRRNLEVIETDLNTIAISFTDTNPAFAAEVVNYIVGELDSINTELSHSTARNTRLFFENRLKVVKQDMDSAHAKLAEFQEKHNFLDLKQQVLSSIEALSLVEAQILTNDINAEMLKSRYGSGSLEANELLKNRKTLERKMQQYLDSGSGELIIPLKNTPKLGIEYTYLMRDVKVQELLHAFLLQNYEQAKLSEAKNTPTINILEHATIPQKKSKPKRMIICVLLFSVGFVIVSFIVFIQKWYALQKRDNTEGYQKLLALKKQIGIW